MLCPIHHLLRRLNDVTQIVDADDQVEASHLELSKAFV